MNFFQQLAQQGDVDMTLRIMGKDGRLTINVMPGSHSSKTKPVVFTGTGEELDAAFFTEIIPAEREIRSLESSVADVKKQLEDEEKAASSKAKKEEKKKPEKKAAAKKAGKAEDKPEEPEVEEPKLFEA